MTRTLESSRPGTETGAARLGLPGDDGGGRRLKILVLDEELPYPPNSGKRIRTWSLLQRLAQRHDIVFLCYGEEGEAAAQLRQLGVRLCLVRPLAVPGRLRLLVQLFLNLFSIYPFTVSRHYSRAFQKRVDQFLAQESFDLIHCEWSMYTVFLRQPTAVPVFAMAHALETRIWIRRALHGRTWAERLFFNLQTLKMRRFERWAVRRADRTGAVTQLEGDQFKAWGAPAIAIVENGVDQEHFQPRAGTAETPEVVFVGALDWHANVDCVRYYLRNIHPLVQEEHPGTRFRAVGRHPPADLVQEFQVRPDVELCADVPDVRPFLAQASVVAVPLRVGGGSRLKILEALAMGRSVVSTTIGAEGLCVRHREHLLLADEPSEFARCVGELLRSPETRRRLGEAGQRLVIERYGWDRIAADLEAAWYATARAQEYTHVAASKAEEATISS